MYSNKLNWVNDISTQNQSLKHLNNLAERIENDIDSDPNSVFDTSKSLIESACKVFLKDLNISYLEKEDLPQLIKLVFINALAIAPLSNTSEEEKKSLKMLTGSINGTVGGICFLRNRLGIIGHGRDVSTQQSLPVIARFVAQIADSISGFILSISKEIRNISGRTRFYYPDHSEFNEWFDEQYPMKAGEYNLSPSEALFNQDPDAYKEELINFTNEKNNEIL